MRADGDQEGASAARHCPEMESLESEVEVGCLLWSIPTCINRVLDFVIKFVPPAGNQQELPEQRRKPRVAQLKEELSSAQTIG